MNPDIEALLKTVVVLVTALPVAFGWLYVMAWVIRKFQVDRWMDDTPKPDGKELYAHGDAKALARLVRREANPGCLSADERALLARWEDQ